MTPSTLWLFGCSFTECVGIKSPTLESVEQKIEYWNKQLYDYTWGKVVQQYLKIPNCKNFGEGGISAYSILNKLTSNIGKIQKDDIVVIGLTSPDRYQYTYKNEDDDIHVQSINPTNLEYLLSAKKVKKSNHYIQVPLVLMEMDDTRWFMLVDFFLNHTEHINTFSLSVNQSILNLRSFLNKNSVKCITWDYEIWHYSSKSSVKLIFETLDVWSQDIIKDQHWSPNGSWLFGQLVNHCVEENIHHIDVTVVEEWYRSKGMQLKTKQYIPFTYRKNYI